MSRARVQRGQRRAPHLAVDLVLDFDDGVMSGTVGRPDGVRLAFNGWIGLMAAIDTLRREREPPTAAP